MARGTPHSPETRAAVLAALLAGQSISDVAHIFKLSKATVIAWRRAAGLDDRVTRVRPVVEPKKGEDIGHLVAAYLTANLTTLRVQQEHFRDKDWLTEQSAADLAVLHGVTADKAFRILEAIQSHGDEELEAGPEDALD